ncbi:hypothetical protein GA0061083_0183 [Pseudarthrobacter enclensis]|nr:hypothetical protein GA0061083_0183 [Pseudarthrobacter enclensis]
MSVYMMDSMLEPPEGVSIWGIIQLVSYQERHVTNRHRST